MLFLLLSIIVGLLLVGAWVLTHLPAAQIAPGPASGLAITNRGLPLSQARVTARLNDGTSAVVHSGALPRGETTVALPPSVNSASISAVEIEGTVFGLWVTAHCPQPPRLAEGESGAP